MDTLASDSEAFTDQAETTETSADQMTIERAENGKQRRAQLNNPRQEKIVSDLDECSLSSCTTNLVLLSQLASGL